MGTLHFTFGELEALLASVHDIADNKRTAFQARLKNFHRLSYPVEFQTTKGKAALYAPLSVVDMALAVELTQLGLPPERAVRVLSMNWFPVAMAVRMAANSLAEHPEGFDAYIEKADDPLSMFIYFDPAALSPLMSSYDLRVTPDLDQASDTFFYGGAAIVKDNLVKWTSARQWRLSLINVTSLLDLLGGDPCPENKAETLKIRRSFFASIAEDAGNRADRGYAITEPPVDFLFRFLEAFFDTPKSPDARRELKVLLENYFGFGDEVIEIAVNSFEQACSAK